MAVWSMIMAEFHILLPIHSTRVLFGSLYDHEEVEVTRATCTAVGMLATQAGVLGLRGGCGDVGDASWGPGPQRRGWESVLCGT